MSPKKSPQRSNLPANAGTIRFYTKPGRHQANERAAGPHRFFDNSFLKIEIASKMPVAMDYVFDNLCARNKTAEEAVDVQAGLYHVIATIFCGVSGPKKKGGQRNPLKRLKTDKRIQGNPSFFPLIFLARIWIRLEKFGLAWKKFGNVSAPYSARRTASRHPR